MLHADIGKIPHVQNIHVPWIILGVLQRLCNIADVFIGHYLILIGHINIISRLQGSLHTRTKCSGSHVQLGILAILSQRVVLCLVQDRVAATVLSHGSSSDDFGRISTIFRLNRSNCMTSRALGCVAPHQKLRVLLDGLENLFIEKGIILPHIMSLHRRLVQIHQVLPAQKVTTHQLSFYVSLIIH